MTGNYNMDFFSQIKNDILLCTVHTLMSLSIPPDMTCSAVSLKETAVTWYVF